MSEEYLEITVIIKEGDHTQMFRAFRAKNVLVTTDDANYPEIVPRQLKLLENPPSDVGVMLSFIATPDPVSSLIFEVQQ